MKFLTIVKYVLLVMLAITGIRLVLSILVSIFQWLVNKIKERRIRKWNEKYGFDEDEAVSY